MYTVPLSGETRAFGGARGGLTLRRGVCIASIASAGIACWYGNPALALAGLAISADTVRHHSLPGWQARSIPFLAAATFHSPLLALGTVGVLAFYRAWCAPQNPIIESTKWAIVEGIALTLGAMAARALLNESSLRAGAAYVLVASVLLALTTLWAWVRARTDLFETRACIAEFGRYLPIKLALAVLAGGVASTEPRALILLAPSALLLAGLHDRDERRKSERSAMLQALCGILRYAHPSTLAHMRRVSEVADRVGAELHLGPRHRARLAEAALLHDIGKVAVDERILEKPGRLTDEERAEVQRHSALGAEIVAASLPNDPIVRWIRSHHERVDGAGYPDALPAGKIPIESRIIAVIDAYDAMIDSKDDPGGRRYRSPITPSDARLELRRCAGGQFDARVVAAFERVLEEGHV